MRAHIKVIADVPFSVRFRCRRARNATTVRCDRAIVRLQLQYERRYARQNSVSDDSRDRGDENSSAPTIEFLLVATTMTAALRRCSLLRRAHARARAC